MVVVHRRLNQQPVWFHKKWNLSFECELFKISSGFLEEKSYQQWHIHQLLLEAHRTGIEFGFDWLIDLIIYTIKFVDANFLIFEQLLET